MIHLTLEELLRVAERTLGDVAIRDVGLLEAAVARPLTSIGGDHAYPTLDTKVAALLHSITRNDALIDGNKRLGLAAVIAYYGMNGRRLQLTNDEAYDLVIAVATGELRDVTAIAERLRTTQL